MNGQLALRVAPQRNTQYAELASALAEPELRRSPLGASISALDRRHIGDAEYLLVDLVDVDEALVDDVLSLLAATSDAFWVDGTSWSPIAVTKAAAVPRVMTEARRYAGKTNELFTRALVNLALFARWGAPGRLRLLDPLCGGGTTLFAALERGCDVVGSDGDAPAVEKTAQFVKQFCKEEGIRCKQRVERHKGRGRDWHHEIGRDGLRCSLLQADLVQLPSAITTIPGGARCHALVADLPYGIQHEGHVEALFDVLLDLGRSTLTGDGVVVLAWNAARVARGQVLDAVDLSGFEVDERNDLAHRVDRVIKVRDVLVATRS